ncbi:MAG: nitrate reductase molybdenum cofactor assembly chaperone [Bifidobacteriaceae bacterium]|jgi:nitrate reductase delta subunit|nr:nitrate reductase molybdenum cofactor assembly chaperone [Bifidobacteriaceae bacterium]
MRRRPAQGLPQAAQIYGLISLMLEYPGEELLAARGRLHAEAVRLGPAGPAGQVRRFADYLLAGSAGALAAAYVSTFDWRSATSLHLTYSEFGDTRARGAALAALKHRYRLASFRPRESELPDYLPLLAEFAALDAAGEAALASCHVGLAVLDQALAKERSPYRHLTRAAGLLLGHLSARGQERLAALIASGPPVEAVGADGACPPWPSPLAAGGGS